MDTNSERYYDCAAAHYAEMSSGRARYLRGVDEILLGYFREAGATSLLDVGAGDGARSRHLAAEGGIQRLTAVESSQGMAEKAKAALGEENVLQVDATQMELPQGSFDAAVCLWNVFGHIPEAQQRVEILRRMGRSLTPSGRIFVDVNNRYNLAHYGWPAVCRNLWTDLCRREGRGWYPLEVDGVRGKVYVHRPGEFAAYAAQSGLRIERTIYVDYATGEERRFPWQGQMLYMMRPA